MFWPQQPLFHSLKIPGRVPPWSPYTHWPLCGMLFWWPTPSCLWGLRLNVTCPEKSFIFWTPSSQDSLITPFFPFIVFLPFTMSCLLAYCLASSLGHEPYMGRDQIVLFTKEYSVPWHSVAHEKYKINFHWMNEWMNGMNERHMEEPSWSQVWPSLDVQAFYVLSSLRPWQGRASFNALCLKPDSTVPSQATAWPSRHFCDLLTLLPRLRLPTPYYWSFQAVHMA